MEITIDIGYEQLLAAIKKLPAAKIKQLKSVLNEEFIEQKATKDLSDFQDFLLKATTMSAEQYKLHQQNRKNFNSWRTK
ncbi:hypothetical protein [Pedobacter borealis]|uniref:hypothetical protein n=1 Tax=Pedobacter borealis TaxID=475254 RepID=UPI00049347FF|nr:hypothetical protein [Pedobacter borealis]